MKKIAVIFLLFIYGFSTLGATVHLHYCMNTFVNWSFTQNKNSKCGKCGMKETKQKKGCCKDEKKQVKLKTDHQKASVANYFSFNDFSTPAILPSYENYNLPLLIKAQYSFKNYRPPPLHYGQSLQVLYCSFLI